MYKNMKIGIIGAGKVGISLSYIMAEKGFDVVAISDKNEDALKDARKYLSGKNIFFTKNNPKVIENAEVIFFAIQDRAIKDVVNDLNRMVNILSNKTIVHTCGSLSSDILKPLDEKGAMLGVFHPLQTFPDIESAIKVIPDTYFFIEAKGKAAEILKYIANSIGKHGIMIKADDMVLYHLCAVFVCNLLCALLYCSENIMKKIDINLTPFVPIIRATLKNIEEKGALSSLTGPIVRGDVDTVLSHLKAIENEENIKMVYKELSLIALEMARQRNTIDEEIYKRFKHILRKD